MRRFPRRLFLAVPLLLLALLVFGNIRAWHHSEELRGALVDAECTRQANQLASRIKDLLHERMNDLTLLVEFFLSRAPEERRAMFERDALQTIEREPIYQRIAIIDDQSIVGASVSLMTLPNIVGKRVQELPAGEKWFQRVVETRSPVTSGAIFLLNGLPGIVLWVPIMEDRGAGYQCTGAISGVLSFDNIFSRVIEGFNQEEFHVEAFLGDKQVFPVPPSRGEFLPGDTEIEEGASAVEILGGSWRVQVHLDETSTLAQLSNQNMLNLGLNISLSFIAFLLIWLAYSAVSRLRVKRRELRASEERLELALDSAGQGVWDSDQILGDTHFSKSWSRMLGYDEEELMPGESSWESRLHPEDAARALKARDACLDGRITEFWDEHRLRMKDGSYRWFHARGRVVVRDLSGRALRMVGTHYDITLQRKAQEELDLARERYRMAISAGKVGVWDFHLDTQEMLATELESILGFDAGELGPAIETWFALVPQEEGKKIMSLVAAHLRGETPRYECEHRMRRKDGSMAWLLCSGTVVERRDGKPVRLVGTSTDVTDRKNAELTLRAQDQHYLMAVLAGRSGVWDYDILTDRLHTDPNLHALFGYARDEFREEQDAWNRIVCPDDQELLQRAARDYIEGHVPDFEVEHRVMCKDGSTRWVLSTGSVFRDEAGKPVRMLGTATDITERRSAREALREASEQAQRYLDIAGVIMLALDVEGRVSLINRKGCEILGYSERELVGRDWFDICLRDPERIAVRERFRTLIMNETVLSDYGENEIITKTDERRLIAWHNVALRDATGNLTGVLSSGEDITDRRRAEEEAKIREQQLIQTDKMASLGVLVSGVAHEINNPNAFILTNIDVLESVWTSVVPVLQRYYESHGDFLVGGIRYSRMSERVPRLISGIRDGARRIKVTVEELRGFARHDPGGLIESINLSEVLNSATTLLANMISKATRRFTLDVEADLPPVLGSFRRIEQVVINLIQNACQALTDTSQAIHVSVTCDRAEDRIVLCVRDEGLGIPDEDLPRIMDPFFTTKRDSGGTGLGLSICDTIVREHHGTLVVCAGEDRGAVATVCLPVWTNNTAARETHA